MEVSFWVAVTEAPHYPVMGIAGLLLAHRTLVDVMSHEINGLLDVRWCRLHTWFLEVVA